MYQRAIFSEKNAIPTYIINLKKRIDRKVHISNEFVGRTEFNITIVDAFENKVGAVGLWDTIKYILKNLANENNEYILICEDDHQFTEHYSKELLFNCIEFAATKDADILLGGVSWLESALTVSKPLFWLETFCGLQFTIIFKKFFKYILNADFGDADAADYKISSLTENKFFIYPFISTQKEFGYSDATEKNNKKGYVTDFFVKTQTTIQHLLNVDAIYKTNLEYKDTKNEQIYDGITIPTYVINLPERKDRLKHIKEQFETRSEFDVTIVEACRHKIGAVGLWLSIRKIIQIAIYNDDDVILICEDDHEFTENYSKKFLLENILEAHQQGVDILLGGIGGGFDHVIPVTKNRYWINNFFSLQFTVIYSKFFQQMLDEPFDDSVTADDFLSELTSNKMVLYPFISIQKDFGYSDVTRKNNEISGTIKNLFGTANDRLKVYKKVYDKYLNK